jgi:hypothetical protein
MAIYSEETDPNVTMWNEQNKPTITHRVVLEIEVEAENPLEAAKEVQRWLQEKDSDWQYYVQPCDKSGDVFSVDLQEEDEDAVLEIENYIPIIK